MTRLPLSLRGRAAIRLVSCSPWSAAGPGTSNSRVVQDRTLRSAQSRGHSFNCRSKLAAKLADVGGLKVFQVACGGHSGDSRKLH